jgi:hypothetical protein
VFLSQRCTKNKVLIRTAIEAAGDHGHGTGAGERAARLMIVNAFLWVATGCVNTIDQG